MLEPTSNARSASIRTAKRRRPGALARTPQGAIGSLVQDLQAFDHRIRSLVETLPVPTAKFHPLSELAAGLSCVRSDLLADAIDTLEALAASDDDALRQHFEERRQWLVAEGE